MLDDLTPSERGLLDAAAEGRPFGDADDGPYDVETMRTWGPERTIRAEVLRHLLVGDDWPVQARGVVVEGIRFVGSLDALDSRVRCPLVLSECLLDGAEPWYLAGATVSRLYFGECYLPGLAGDGLVVTSGVVLRQCTVEGGVRLVGTQITGGLDCEGTSFGGEDGCALTADRAVVRGGVFLADIEADGSVRFASADIAGPVTLDGARLGADDQGNALMADGVSIRGALGLAGVVATGAIRLPGATIDGQLQCRDARLDGTDGIGDSLVAFGAAIGGDALLDGDFHAAGRVHLRSTRIGGSVLLGGALDGDTAFYAPGARVEHEFRWRPAAPVGGVVVLERMTVGRLTDDWTKPGAHWPPRGRLRLTGFTYDGFGSAATVAQRLDWVRRQDPFSTQPYEQLVRVYTQAGQDTDARTVAIAKRNDLRERGEMTPLRKAGSRALDVTIKHGYQPGRAVVLLVALYVAVLGVFWHAQHRRGAIVPARDTTAAADPLRCRVGYPCFYPATYALDVVVPILDIRDADAWRPRGGGYAALTVVATGLGWAFSTLAVLGYTGIVRRE